MTKNNRKGIMRQITKSRSREFHAGLNVMFCSHYLTETDHKWAKKLKCRLCKVPYQKFTDRHDELAAMLIRGEIHVEEASDDPRY